MPNFKVNGVYSFSTYTKATTGAVFQNAKLLAELSYEIAKTFANVDVDFYANYPSLPEALPKDPSRYSYYQFLTNAGSKILLCSAWINAASVVENTSAIITVQIQSSNPQDPNNILQLLNQAGFRAMLVS